MTRLPPSFAKHLKVLPGQQARPISSASAQRHKDESPAVGQALRMAAECQRRGEIARAENIFVSILLRDPGNVPALLLAGSLARSVDDFSIAIGFFKKALEVEPDSVEANLRLGATYSEAREHDEALRHFRRVVKLRPNLVAGLGAMGKAMTASGDAESALPLFAKATKLQPNHPSLRCDHAEALIALGRMEEAERLLRENIALGLGIAASFRALADTRQFDGDPPELDAIKAVLKRGDLSRREREDLHHAAGKILNDVGRHEEALDQFQSSKQANGYRFDIEAARRTVDALVSSFTPELIRSKAGFGDPSEVPVFVVGMPRSGTTLVEQISASHPAVHGAGEMAKLGILLQAAGYADSSGAPARKPVQTLTSEEARSIAADYLGFVEGLSPASARFVDKMPHNFQHIGMIALLFPNARIVHCTRDPIDNCVSCFFNTFNKRHAYNTDLHTLGLYYREYHRLMQHWHALLPGRIHECNYEAMIADQEGESRRLIEFLGLPWDDACLRFHETDRSVTTPSRWQVRQPIYQTSVKRWKKYGDKIRPLIEALGDLADT